MKKTLMMLFVLSFLTGMAMAQNEALPDGKFEYWKQELTYDKTPYDDVANPFWASLNMLSTLSPDMFTGPVTLFKDKGRSGAEGDFAPKMVSNFLKFGQDKEIFLPGVVGAITVLTDKQSAQFGRPFTSRPKSIRGYMKYAPVNNDSASIFVELYKYNPDTKVRRMIGRVEQHYKSAVSDWTKFDLTIRYTSDDTPDSATVLFVSSAGYRFDSLFECKGQIGSTLWVDDCEFVYADGSTGEQPDTPTAIETVQALKVSVYPNPATDELNLFVEEDGQLILMNQAGQMVRRQAVTAGENRLNIGELRAGFYTYQVIGAQKSGSGKFIKK